MQILNKIPKIKDSILLFLAVAGVAGTLFNSYLINQLSPIYANQQAINIQVKADEGVLNTEIKNRQEADLSTLTLINARFDDLVGRTNAIANRISSVQDALLKR